MICRCMPPDYVPQACLTVAAPLVGALFFCIAEKVHQEQAEWVLVTVLASSSTRLISVLGYEVLKATMKFSSWFFEENWEIQKLIRVRLRNTRGWIQERTGSLELGDLHLRIPVPFCPAHLRVQEKCNVMFANTNSAVFLQILSTVRLYSY